MKNIHKIDEDEEELFNSILNSEQQGFGNTYSSMYRETSEISCNIL